MYFAGVLAVALACSLRASCGAETKPVDYDSSLDLQLAEPCITKEVWALCGFESKPFRSLQELGAAESREVVLESANWPSSEIVANVAHIILREVLGLGVLRFVDSDYLEPYARINAGNVTMVFETWDLQMTEAWANLPELHNVEKRSLGMVGLESLWMPSYAQARRLTNRRTCTYL